MNSSHMNPGNDEKRVALAQYLHATSQLHSILGAMFKAISLDDWNRYNRAFRICRRPDLPDVSDGVWMGRAIVWNLQTHVHVDAGDGVDSWCATVNGGSYRSFPDPDANSDHYGTAMVFPQLGIAIRYNYILQTPSWINMCTRNNPGDVLIFRSGALLHLVLPWQAKYPMPYTGLSPGRFAHVFFSHEEALQMAKDKDFGYVKRTSYGNRQLPSESCKPSKRQRTDNDQKRGDAVTLLDKGFIKCEKKVKGANGKGTGKGNSKSKFMT
jgi:hypothetical protein